MLVVIWDQHSFFSFCEEILLKSVLSLIETVLNSYLQTLHQMARVLIVVEFFVNNTHTETTESIQFKDIRGSLSVFSEKTLQSVSSKEEEATEKM